MIPFKPDVLTSVLPTREKRREVMQAMRTLAAQDDERLRQRQTDIAPLRRDFEQLREALPGLLRQAIEEARRECDPRLWSRVIKYSPDQPRGAIVASSSCSGAVLLERESIIPMRLPPGDGTARS
jgi:hypothetical protein